MKRAVFLCLALIGFVFAGAGCGTPNPSSSITVSVTGCQSTDHGPVITLRYINESVYALGVTSASHKLYLGGKLVAELPATPPVGVPPLKATNQDVALQFSDPAYVQELALSASAGAVPYRLVSKLFETVGENDFNAKLDVTGTLDLRPLAGK